MIQFAAYCLMFLGAAVLSIIVTALQGVLFMFLWNYAATTYWASAPELSFPIAWASVLLIGFFKGHSVLTETLAKKLKNETA